MTPMEERLRAALEGSEQAREAAIEKLAKAHIQRDHLYELVDRLWGNLTKDQIQHLDRVTVEECKAIHEKVWHDDPRLS